jgi:Holliday junction resolvasome RuvABC endonuclease subunit
MNVLVMDIAINCTGVSIWKNGVHIISDIQKPNSTSKKSWIPEGEWRSEKELYSKKKGKLVKKPDNMRNMDITNNKILSLHKKITEIVIQNDIDYIVVELPIFAIDIKTAINIGKVQTIAFHGLPIIGYYPLTWKNSIKNSISDNMTLTNSKNKEYKLKSVDKNKKDSILFYINKTDNIPKSSDEADAYCIGYYHHNIDSSNFSYKNMLNHCKNM